MYLMTKRADQLTTAKPMDASQDGSQEVKSSKQSLKNMASYYGIWVASLSREIIEYDLENNIKQCCFYFMYLDFKKDTMTVGDVLCPNTTYNKRNMNRSICTFYLGIII